MTWWFSGKHDNSHYLAGRGGVYIHGGNLGMMVAFTCQSGKNILLRPSDMMDVLGYCDELLSYKHIPGNEKTLILQQRRVIDEAIDTLPGLEGEEARQLRLVSLQPRMATEDFSPAVVSMATEVISRFTRPRFARKHLG